jgi:hypothetical protein
MTSDATNNDGLQRLVGHRQTEITSLQLANDIIKTVLAETDKLALIFTGVLTLVGIIGIVVAVCTLRVMQRQNMQKPLQLQPETVSQL